MRNSFCFFITLSKPSQCFVYFFWNFVVYLQTKFGALNLLHFQISRENKEKCNVVGHIGGFSKQWKQNQENDIVQNKLKTYCVGYTSLLVDLELSENWWIWGGVASNIGGDLGELLGKWACLAFGIKYFKLSLRQI